LGHVQLLYYWYCNNLFSTEAFGRLKYDLITT
jgi:hypothetical protein